MTPDASLLVPPPSTHQSGTHLTGDETQASASLNAAATGGVGRVQLMGICTARDCGREFPLRHKSDDLPNHHPGSGTIGALRQICFGSGRRTTLFTEA